MKLIFKQLYTIWKQSIFKKQNIHKTFRYLTKTFTHQGAPNFWGS